MTLEEFLGRLDGVRPQGDGYMARCRAHPDRTPSLLVRAGTEGSILLHCYAGCTAQEIVEAMGLDIRDLFDANVMPMHQRRRPAPASKPQHASTSTSASADAAVGKQSTTVYAIRNAAGVVVAEHVREDMPPDPETGDPRKRMWWRRDGHDGLGGLKARDLPLYGVEILASVPKGATVILTEGEPAKDALTRRGMVAVGTVTGASGMPSDDVLRPLLGYAVVLWPDADAPGRAHMQRIAARLTALGIAPVLLDPWAEKTAGEDAANWTGTTAELRALLDATTTPAEPSSVLSTLLAEVEQFVTRYVVLPPFQLVAVVLWVAHAHAVDAADATPYLAVTSPVKRCGKTRLLEVLEPLVPGAWRVVSLSEAVLFRKIAKAGTTVLLDEVDAIFRERDDSTEGVRAVLNAGNRRGTVVARCVGKGHELRDFPVFCPKVLAGIGALPDTVADRSIPVRLQRRTVAEPVARLRPRALNTEAQPVRDGLATWAAAVLPVLRDTEPDVPDALNDRAAEAWEPLLAIADLAGGAWPRRARDAALALHEVADVESSGVALLAALGESFIDPETRVVRDRLLTRDLLDLLAAREGEPWGSWWGQALAKGDIQGPAYKLAKLLRPFGIKSHSIRVGDERGQGFDRADFADAWSRYLSPVPNLLTSRQPAPDAGFRVFRGPDTPPAVMTSKVAETLGAQGLSRCQEVGVGGRAERLFRFDVPPPLREPGEEG